MIYLYGASGHGKVIAEIARANGITIHAFIDDNPQKDYFFDYSVKRGIPNDIHTKQVLISIGDNRTRAKVAFRHHSLSYTILKHPNAEISPSALLNKGTVVMSGVTINADVRIGSHVIVNTNSSIDHDCIVEDFVHISPNVGLAGGVQVGEGTHIGIGASVIPNVKIGRWCVIGAGTVVINDVPDGCTVVGNPGRIIKMDKVLFTNTAMKPVFKMDR